MKGVRKIHYGPRDNPKVIEQRYYTVDELKEGWLYRVRARNARLGIWTPEYSGFHISREKFGRNYLFVEIHWDLSDSFGTVLPLEEIELAPFNVEWLKDWHTKRSVERNVLEYLNRRARELLEDYRGP
jgi:hypothetical protein